MDSMNITSETPAGQAETPEAVISPLPWWTSQESGKASDIKYNHPLGFVADVGFVFSGVDGEGVPNAALIVRAVNCHDELVRRLRALLSLSEMLAANCTDRLDLSNDATISAAKATLAKAEGRAA